MPEADFAFFDLKASTELPTAEILRHPVAFRVAVHKFAYSTGRWTRIGQVEPPPKLIAPQPKFMRDRLSGEFSIYLGGHIRRVQRADCVGLERSAVWDPNHVEDRLRDHFAGVPNKWVESLALKEEAL